MSELKTSDFYFDLPEELIAQKPSEKRENSKMMVLDRENHQILHKNFFNIVDFLDENCVLILNNTKVMPSRIYGIKEVTNAKIEVLLLKELEKKVRKKQIYTLINVHIAVKLLNVLR